MRPSGRRLVAIESRLHGSRTGFRRELRNLHGASGIHPVDPKLASGCANAALVTSTSNRNLVNLTTFSAFLHRQLDPFGGLERTLQRRQVGPMQVFGDLNQARLAVRGDY